jgi:integration host factor subunit alpha
LNPFTLTRLTLKLNARDIALGPTPRDGTLASSPLVAPRVVLLSTIETPTLTKAELADLLFDGLGLNKREARDMVEGFFDLISNTLVAGHDVKMSGFGNFNIRRKAPRPGRNPRTGEVIQINAKHVVTFHPSHKLKGLVQGDVPIQDELE